MNIHELLQTIFSHEDENIEPKPFVLEKKPEKEESKPDPTVQALPSIFTTPLPTPIDDAQVTLAPLPPTQPFELNSALQISSIDNETLCRFVHDSKFFGKLEFNIKQVQEHTMHYHINAAPFSLQPLQAFLPSLIENIQKTLPKQTHHVHGVYLKKDKNRKKVIAQYP
jgi:hypothetical protein